MIRPACAYGCGAPVPVDARNRRRRFADPSHARPRAARALVRTRDWEAILLAREIHEDAGIPRG